ncbi:hypothetical protein PTKIN_Ptkin18bG0097700 [Pterospermum kingtungense]
MALHQIETNQEEAEIYHGAALCKQKSMELLDLCRLPRGLLPLNDLVEVGRNQKTGFVWLKQQRSLEYRFKAIGRTVLYETEVTAYVEDRRMRRLTGVKTKELLVWLTISDISVDDSNPGMITFANPTGLSRSFPITAFEAEREESK